MNLVSIKSKLLIGGTLLILIPICISGYLSYAKSHSALLNLSMQTAEGVAKDLSRLTDKILANDLYLAASMASEKTIVDIAAAVNEIGADNLPSEISVVF